MGPICLLLFQLAAILPFKSVASGIAAVTLADAVYILISLLGIVGIIKQVKSTSEFFKKINGVIIVYLGLSFALMSFTDRVSYLDMYDWGSRSVFVGVLLLTMLNPVTIICYTGVFNAKVMDLKMSNRGLFQFGFGTLLSTPIFMTFVVVLGALGGKFLPDMVVNIMNLVVGCCSGDCVIFFRSLSLSREKRKNNKIPLMHRHSRGFSYDWRIRWTNKNPLLSKA